MSENDFQKELHIPPGFIVLDDQYNAPNIIAIAHIVRYYAHSAGSDKSTIITTNGAIVVQASESLITNYIRRAMGIVA